MKKLFALLICSIALSAAAADVIVPPADKTVRLPLNGALTGERGGFVVEFTLNFTDPAKNYIGYMISCRNWKKPFRGFAFGVNRVKGKSAIWFYPIDENNKAFGFYKTYPLESGKRYRAELTWEGRNCKLVLDGKNVISCRLKQAITTFETIEIGGLGGKNRGVTIHSFKYISEKKK